MASNQPTLPGTCFDTEDHRLVSQCPPEPHNRTPECHQVTYHQTCRSGGLPACEQEESDPWEGDGRRLHPACSSWQELGWGCLCRAQVGFCSTALGPRARCDGALGLASATSETRGAVKIKVHCLRR